MKSLKRYFIFLLSGLVFLTANTTYLSSFISGFSKNLVLAPLSGFGETTSKAIRLDAELKKLGNNNNSRKKILQFLSTNKQKTLLEIGCGKGNTSLEIARNNKDINVIAIDIFNDEDRSGYYYDNYTKPWENNELEAQKENLPNLVILRSTSDILKLLPKNFLNWILFVKPDLNDTDSLDAINPARNLMLALRNSPSYIDTIKEGGQVVIQPRYPLSDYELFEMVKSSPFQWKVNINESSDWKNEEAELQDTYAWTKSNANDLDYSLDKALFPHEFIEKMYKSA